MDVTSTASAISQLKVIQAIDVKLTKMQMDSATENMQQMVKLMELSVSPNIGSNLDIKL